MYRKEELDDYDINEKCERKITSNFQASLIDAELPVYSLLNFILQKIKAKFRRDI